MYITFVNAALDEEQHLMKIFLLSSDLEKQSSGAGEKKLNTGNWWKMLYIR